MKYKVNEKMMYTSYKRQNKWLGIIDYKSLCVILIYIFIIISVLEIVNLDLEKSFYIFLFLTVPFIAVMFININNESAISVVLTILKFVINRGIYVDKKFKKIDKKYTSKIYIL